MTEYLRDKGANPGRAGHRMAIEAGRIILDTRSLLAGLFNIPDPARIIFTLNCTESLNLAIKGLLKPGDHVIISSMEHNAASRPVHKLTRQGVQRTIIRCSPEGHLDPADVRRAIVPSTRMIVLTHASNVTGTLMPAAEVGRIAREHGILFLLDGAQTAGRYPIDVAEMGIDLLAVPGHKGLLGPPGTGALYIREGLLPNTLIEGGTGTHSEEEDQPLALPERYESGTINSAGIAGLGAGLRFIADTGMDRIREREQLLVRRLRDGLTTIDGIIVYGPRGNDERVPVLSVNVEGMDSAEVGHILDRAFDVAIRPGLHCAPLAHKTIGTLDGGTVRLSPGFFNNELDIDRAIEALAAIAAQRRRRIR